MSQETTSAITPPVDPTSPTITQANNGNSPDAVTTADNWYRDEFVDIEVLPAAPVQVKLDLNRLTWGDLTQLQGALGGGETPQADNMQILATILNKVMIGVTVEQLPVMSLQRVLRFVMQRMQGMANQGN